MYDLLIVIFFVFAVPVLLRIVWDVLSFIVCLPFWLIKDRRRRREMERRCAPEVERRLRDKWQAEAIMAKWQAEKVMAASPRQP